MCHMQLSQADVEAVKEEIVNEYVGRVLEEVGSSHTRTSPNAALCMCVGASSRSNIVHMLCTASW